MGIHFYKRGDTMAAIEKAIDDFFNSGSLKAAAYRANAIFGFSSKVLSALAFVCWMSTAFLQPMAVPKIDTSRVSVVRGEGSCLTGSKDYYDSKQADQGFITFDLQADLAPLFNWNVKVLFLYLSAEYSTPTTSHNTAVLGQNHYAWRVDKVGPEIHQDKVLLPGRIRGAFRGNCKPYPFLECDAKRGPPHMGESRGETHFHLPNRVLQCEEEVSLTGLK